MKGFMMITTNFNLSHGVLQVGLKPSFDEFSNIDLDVCATLASEYEKMDLSKRDLCELFILLRSLAKNTNLVRLDTNATFMRQNFRNDFYGERFFISNSSAYVSINFKREEEHQVRSVILSYDDLYYLLRIEEACAILFQRLKNKVPKLTKRFYTLAKEYAKKNLFLR